MNRRGFITVASAAAAWPGQLRAQTQRLPTIGFLSSGLADTFRNPLVALRLGLQQEGFVEGATLAIEYRWADNHYDRLSALAADLVRSQVAVIVAAGGTITPVAARSVTSATPIVFTGVSNPVGGGLIASMNRPGGNMTGVSVLGLELDAKRLELLHVVAPTADVIGALFNPNNPATETQTSELLAAGRTIGRELLLLRAGADSEFDRAFELMAERGARALLVAADPYFVSRRDQIVKLAARHAVPAIYQFRDFVEVGGLMSYGPKLEDAYQQAGRYTGRILKGEKPADLPVVQSDRIEFILNLSTAKSLGIMFPQSIILRASEVVE